MSQKGNPNGFPFFVLHQMKKIIVLVSLQFFLGHGFAIAQWKISFYQKFSDLLGQVSNENFVITITGIPKFS